MGLCQVDIVAQGGIGIWVMSSKGVQLRKQVWSAMDRAPQMNASCPTSCVSLFGVAGSWGGTEEWTDKDVVVWRHVVRTVRGPVEILL